jgi:hypothetical protein
MSGRKEKLKTGVDLMKATVIFAVILCCMWLTGCDLQGTATSQQCTVTDDAVKAQAAANKAIADSQVVTQKRMLDVQMAVVKTCADKGGYPQIVGGNVSCQTK